MRLLITGAAGFIGFHAALKMIDLGHEVLGVDNLNDYYDPKLKQARLDILLGMPGFSFVRLDLADRASTPKLFAGEAVEPIGSSSSQRGMAPVSRRGFDAVIHLAAQAGVRYSLTNPHAYVDANLQAFINVLEGCRHNAIPHLIYASSSSVYGGNTKLPFSETDRVDTPVSLYAATKKANELMAHTYSHLFGLRTTGLRFFTVYGPWGRPDMAMFKFTRAILASEEIEVYGHGEMWRDFTYVDDIVDGIVRLTVQENRNVDQSGKQEIRNIARSGNKEIRNQEQSGEIDEGGVIDESASRNAVPYRIYNIGHNKPEYLMDLIELLENELGSKARIKFLPMQPGDVPKTYADIDALHRDFGFEPKTALAEGVKRFVNWYREYHGKYRMKK